MTKQEYENACVGISKKHALKTKSSKEQVRKAIVEAFAGNKPDVNYEIVRSQK